MAMSLAAITQKETVKDCEFEIAGMKETYDELRIAQEEVGGTFVWRAKIPSGGGRSFEITEGDNLIASVPSFSGVIIHNYKCNARYGSEMGLPPICSSLDGNNGLDTETGEMLECKNCEYNKYGTDKNGRGKACKNMHRVYVLTEGNPIPVLLSIAPTSLRNWQDYRLSLASKKLKPSEVKTEFSLEIKSNSEKTNYSVVKFNLEGKISAEAAAIAAMVENGFKATTEITADDYNRREAAADESGNA